MSRWNAVWMVVLCGLAVAIAPQTASACAVCRCGDPTLTVMGTEKPFEGRFRLSLELRHQEESFGEGPLQSTLREEELRLGVAWAPHERIFISALAPMVFKRLTHPNLGVDEVAHVGDLQTIGRFYVLAERRHQAGLTLGLRAPTAPEQLGDDGDPLDIDAQTGLGAWVPSIGGWYGHFNFPWSLYVSSTVYFPGQGWQGFEGGTSLQSSLSAQYQPDPIVAIQAGLDSRLSLADRFAGALVNDTGGGIVFASAGLGVSPAMDWLLSFQLQFRWPRPCAAPRKRASPSRRG